MLVYEIFQIDGLIKEDSLILKINQYSPNK